MNAQFLNQMAMLFKWEANGRNIGVENCLWEVWGLQVYDKIIRPSVGDVVIDAGAHIGSFTVRASQMVGETGKVYAFEPNLNNFHWLTINTGSLHNVQTFNKALWSSNKMIELFVIQYPYVGFSAFGSSVKTAVPAVTLDEIVFGKVNFIKIDVEGSELEVLKGAKRILEEHHPYIVMEIHGWDLVEKVEQFLSDFDYHCLDKELVFTYAEVVV